MRKQGVFQNLRNLAAGVSGALLLTLCSYSAGAGELSLAPELMVELNQVLKVSDSLHKSLMSQDEDQVELNLRDMVQELERAKRASRVVKEHDRGHLLRVLAAASEQFELTQSTYGDERLLRLEEGYNQIVNLIRVYRVDRAYGIFFCPKDRTTWVQRGGKPQNPFRADTHREPCGLRVPR